MQFGLIEMWYAMGYVAKFVAILLISLSIITLYLFVERLIVFARAKSKSKQLAPKLAELMKAGKIQEALTLASKKEYRGSHLGRITAAGIKEFIEGGEAGLPLEGELKRGLPIVSTVAVSSPFIGLFGTIAGIINAFRGMALTGSGGIGAVAGGISEALITTAFGIGVAIIALWCFNSLNSKTEVLDAEMQNASSEVIDFFIRKSMGKS